MWREYRRHCTAILFLFICLFIVVPLSIAVTADGSDEGPVKAQPGFGNVVPPTDAGVAFVEGSDTQIVVEHDGKRYLVDVAHHEIKEVAASEPTKTTPEASSGHPTSGSEKPGNLAAQSTAPAVEAAPKKKDTVYRAGDDLVFDVPTGRRVERHGLYIDFTHRFPYEPAFTSSGRGNTLLGLDDFAVPSFGFRYGLTSRLYAFASRSPSIIGRPIELMLGYNFLDEHDGSPLNLAARFSVDGQNNFQSEFCGKFRVDRLAEHRQTGTTVRRPNVHHTRSSLDAGQQFAGRCDSGATLFRSDGEWDLRRSESEAVRQHFFTWSGSFRGYQKDCCASGRSYSDSFKR